MTQRSTRRFRKATRRLVICLGIALPLLGQGSQAVISSGLTQRRIQLEDQVAALREGGKRDDDPRLRKTVAELAEVAAEEDSLLQGLPPAAKGGNSLTHLRIPVYFATDRAGNDRVGYSEIVRESGVDYGSAAVSISVPYPVRADRIAGSKVIAKQMSIERKSFPDSTAFFSALQASAISVSPKRRILVFIHGYNVSFDEAMTSAATLASVVGYNVVPIAYSWPSAGKVSEYWHDEEVVRVSYLRLSAFLAQLLQQPNVEVTIVAHSMGARELTSALLDLQRSRTALPALRNVSYAAGDVFQQEFVDVWRYLSALSGVRFSSYTSSHDLPLRISHYIHTDPRLGDSTGTPLTVSGLDTIEASAADPAYQALGHSYIIKSPRVGADLGAWIDAGLAPEARGLIRVKREGKSYYVFP